MSSWNPDMKVWHDGYEAGRKARTADEWALHMARMRAINRLKELGDDPLLGDVCPCFFDHDAICGPQLRDELVRLLGGDAEMGRVESEGAVEPEGAVEHRVRVLEEAVESLCVELEGLKAEVGKKMDKFDVTVTTGHMESIGVPQPKVVPLVFDPNVVQQTVTRPVSGGVQDD